MDATNRRRALLTSARDTVHSRSRVRGKVYEEIRRLKRLRMALQSASRRIAHDGVLLLAYLLVGGLTALMLCSGVNASPVCHEVRDAYRLALADMQGTGNEKWAELVEAGDCADVPATYLYTLDTYTSDEETRVVAMLAYKKVMWGLMTSLPSYLRLATWKPEYAQNNPAVRDWYRSRTMTEDTRKRLGWSWKSCCDHGDVVHTDIRRTTIFGVTQWYWLDGATWKQIPADIVQYGQFPPNNEPVLFIYQGEAVCFFPPDVGGI